MSTDDDPAVIVTQMCPCGNPDHERISVETVAKAARRGARVFSRDHIGGIPVDAFGKTR